MNTPFLNRPNHAYQKGYLCWVVLDPIFQNSQGANLSDGVINEETSGKIFCWISCKIVYSVCPRQWIASHSPA